MPTRTRSLRTAIAIVAGSVLAALALGAVPAAAQPTGEPAPTVTPSTNLVAHDQVTIAVHSPDARGFVIQQCANDPQSRLVVCDDSRYASFPGPGTRSVPLTVTLGRLSTGGTCDVAHRCFLRVVYASYNGQPGYQIDSNHVLHLQWVTDTTGKLVVPADYLPIGFAAPASESGTSPDGSDPAAGPYGTAPGATPTGLQLSSMGVPAGPVPEMPTDMPNPPPAAHLARTGATTLTYLLGITGVGLVVAGSACMAMSRRPKRRAAARVRTARIERTQRSRPMRRP